MGLEVSLAQQAEHAPTRGPAAQVGRAPGPRRPRAPTSERVTRWPRFSRRARVRRGCAGLVRPGRGRAAGAGHGGTDTHGTQVGGWRRRGSQGWLTALSAPPIAAQAAPGRPLQLSLFDAADLAEITHPDYPGERLFACRNPFLAAERGRKRGERWPPPRPRSPIASRVAAGKLSGADRIGLAVGKVINRHGTAWKTGSAPTC